MPRAALIYGKNGQLATCLRIHAEEFGFVAVNIGRPEAELSNFAQLEAKIKSYSPTIIINASAFNDVDGAETQRENAMEINAKGPENLAKIAAKFGIPFVHVSTDYVFDGKKGGPYCESDATNPINFYGQTKLAGEQLVAIANEDHVIIRTSWVYSEFASSFPKRILQIACDGREGVSIVNDQFGSPTSAHDLARAILKVSTNLLSQPKKSDFRGIFHYASKNAASRSQFTRYIFEAARKLGRKCANVIEVSADYFKTPAERPRDTSLDCRNIEKIHGVSLNDWQFGIDEVIGLIIKSLEE